MALTPEQLRMAIAGYRGSSPPSLGVPQLAPIAPELAAPVAVTPVAPPVVATPVVTPMTANVAQPKTYRAGVQQALDAYRGAQAEGVQVAKAVGDVKAQASDEKAALINQRVAEIDADAGPDRTKSTESRARADQLFGQYQAMQDEINKTEIKRDRRTQGQQAVDVVARALAGIGDALSSMGNERTNVLGQMEADIQAGIQQDVEDQRMALNDKRSAAEGKLNEYGIARQILGDDEQAEQKAYEWATAKSQQRHAAQLEAQAAKSGSMVEKLAAEFTAANLKAQAAQTEMGVWEHLEAGRMAAGRPSSMTMISPELMYRMQRDAQADERNPEVMAQTPGAQLTGDLTVRDGKVAPVHAKNTEKLQGTIDAARAAISTIDQALALREQSNWGKVPFTDDNATLENLKSDLDISMKTIQELGQLTGGDMALMRGQTGDTTGVWGSNDVKLKQLKKNLQRRVGGAVFARGFEVPPELVVADEPKTAARPNRTAQVIANATKPKPAAPAKPKADAVGGDDW